MVIGWNHLGDRAPDPLASLRHAVDDLHQAVDERSSLGAVGLDVHGYGAALVALARVLPSVEAELLRAGAHRYPSVPLTPLLVDDVEALGLDVGSAPFPAVGLDVDDAGAWWGASYVLHGSRLGSTVIVERLARDLPEVPRTYFDAAAHGARPSWAAFRIAARQAFVAGGADLQRAAEAARAVFGALLREFELAGRPRSTSADGRVA